MVDSRAKGQRGEYLVRDMLRDASGLQFERVPSSGALAYLKGDLYIPDANNAFCIEVKNYEKSPLSDKVFTNKTNYLLIWWEKIVKQAELKLQQPLLFFRLRGLIRLMRESSLLLVEEVSSPFFNS